MNPEFLIIGQGICGTWLSYYLLEEGRSVLVIDNHLANAASRVAAGIINPVTGRRIVKTWMIDELLEFIVPAYQHLGKQLGIHSISACRLVDFHSSPQMKLAFDDRIREGADFLSRPLNQDQYREQFRYAFGFGEVNPVYLVNLKDILAAWRKQLEQRNLLIEENFSVKDMEREENRIRYRNITAEKIIFCDGILSASNPYFSNLPFALNKGEALLIETDQLPTGIIFKKGMMLTPVEKDRYWLGSSYLWDYRDDQPSDPFRKQAEGLLAQWLVNPYKVVDHFAAIRPANLERRPFAGMHPIYKPVGILNGMGTKGCSLAPYFAKCLAEHLCRGTRLPAGADIQRFTKILTRT